MYRLFGMLQGEFILDENLDLVLRAESSAKNDVAFVIICTDDVDLIGERGTTLQDIHDICDEEWVCKASVVSWGTHAQCSMHC